MEIKHPSYYKKLAKEKNKKCKTCKGTGKIETKIVFSDLWEMDCGTREETCNSCNGTGSE